MPEGVENSIGLMYYSFEHRLQGKAQEAAMAQLFLEDQERQMNDPKMLVYAERFLQLYPETLWQPLVQEAMEKNRAFNQTRIPEDIHFPDVSQAKTFQDIIAPYNRNMLRKKTLFCCISQLIIRKPKRNGRRWLLIMI